MIYIKHELTDWQSVYFKDGYEEIEYVKVVCDSNGNIIEFNSKEDAEKYFEEHHLDDSEWSIIL